DGAEPVRSPGRKLHGFTGVDGEILITQDEPEPAGKHVHPVLALVHRQFVRRDASTCTDPNLVCVQAPRWAVASQRPIRDVVVSVRPTFDAGVLRLWR